MEDDSLAAQLFDLHTGPILTNICVMKGILICSCIHSLFCTVVSETIDDMTFAPSTCYLSIYTLKAHTPINSLSLSHELEADVED